MENLEFYMERLRKIRISKEIKQTTIAKSLGVSQSQYSTWETSKKEMSFLTYIKIAKILNVSIDYLTGNKRGSIDY